VSVLTAGAVDLPSRDVDGPRMKRFLFAIAALVSLAACEPSFDYGVKKYEVRRLQGILAQTPCNKEALVSLLEVMNEAGDTVGVTKQTSAYTAKCGELPWTPWLTHDYGGRLQKVKSLVDVLDKEPCDKGRFVQLLDEMVGAGDYRNTLKRADAFFAKCGDLPRARWLTYEAHKRLSEYDAAIGEASKLIESDRYDRDFWWWRGNAYSLKGEHDKALADFQEVLKLCPNCTVGWQIADASEKLGRPCEGIVPLETVATNHPDASDIDQLRRRIALLRERPDCKGIGGTVSTTSVTMPDKAEVRDADVNATKDGAPGRKR
jgi:tetratricopeptide (TPR) repeat protein